MVWQLPTSRVLQQACWLSFLGSSLVFAGAPLCSFVFLARLQGIPQGLLDFHGCSLNGPLGALAQRSLTSCTPARKFLFGGKSPMEQ